MNAILAGLREFALYGLIWSLLGKNILFAIIAIGLYLLFMLFTWLKAKRFTESMSDELGVDIPTNNYFIYLFRITYHKLNQNDFNNYICCCFGQHVGFCKVK